jgi:hypothetical protein
LQARRCLPTLSRSPVLEWTISHNGAQVTGRSYAHPGSARRAALAAWAAALGIKLGEEYHQDSRMTTITGTTRGAGNSGARNGVRPSSLLNIAGKGRDYAYGPCWR